jgi:hypothetical protein
MNNINKKINKHHPILKNWDSYFNLKHRRRDSIKSIIVSINKLDKSKVLGFFNQRSEQDRAKDLKDAVFSIVQDNSTWFLYGLTVQEPRFKNPIEAFEISLKQSYKTLNEHMECVIQHIGENSTIDGEYGFPSEKLETTLEEEFKDLCTFRYNRSAHRFFEVTIKDLKIKSLQVKFVNMLSDVCLQGDIQDKAYRYMLVASILAYFNNLYTYKPFPVLLIEEK